MNLIPRSAILCLCFSVGSLFAVAQGTCVFTSDPGKKTVKLTGDCGAIAGVKTQTGYTVDNSPEPATPSGPPKLEDMSAMPPTVDYQNGDLTIMAPNSTLSAILEAVRIKTGAEIEIPAGADSERVVGKIGPGAAREVLRIWPVDRLSSALTKARLIGRSLSEACPEATVPTHSPRYRR